ncbi:hypothetical protein I0Q91_04620 [Halanaerobiaceae bacterium Z-7014]|uniref:Uncharacterized protein n=1 Tax=Halonatronomonas betaini TaxID=2778430 RepID=A0A931ATV1_9FIRM|nr:hypothetical protein [Halonatronomonas betaini]MBF8436355.1 hypothetical protein [Halonatronomonas betaini]
MREGKYKVYQVGEERVVAKSHEEVENYAKEKGISSDKVKYRLSIDNPKGLSEKYKML